MRGKKVEKLNEFRQIFILIGVGVLLFLLFRTSIFQPVINTFQIVTVPLQTSFHQTTKGVISFFQTIGQIGGLRATNSDLLIKNSVLEAENSNLKKLKEENDNLKSQLGVHNKDLKIVAAAHPIGNGAVGVKNVLLIDKGTNDKVHENDLVVIGNILIGKVVEVSPKVSSVQLLSDPESKIPAITESAAEGILQGEFGSEIKLTDVVQEKVLKVGELVKTSGRNSWPRGLIMGKISKVNKVEKDFFQSAQVIPTIDLNDVSLIYVVKF